MIALILPMEAVTKSLSYMLSLSAYHVMWKADRGVDLSFYYIGSVSLW